MKLSTTAALFALAAAQGANAIDFDFRDFEGLWESADLNVVKAASSTDQGQTGLSTLSTFSCKATGDFRKAMCEFDIVIPDSESYKDNFICEDVIDSVKATPVLEGKLILDQLDADTGVTKTLLVPAKCCSDDSTCSPADKNLNVVLTMLPGKSNNHVRAIEAKVGLGSSSKPFGNVETTFQLRRKAGGFKSYA